MEKIVSRIAALGVPGLVLILAIHTTGYAGGAAIITALAAIGPGGILGGIATLGVLGIIVQGITEYGMEAVFSAVIDELIRRGETQQSILYKIDRYPISRSLKRKLLEQVNK